MEMRLEMTINKLEQWCNGTGFILSPAKTVSMLICRKRLLSKMAHQLSLSYTPIMSVETYRFLGVIVVKYLSCRNHIINLKIVCNKKLNLLKHLSHKSWGSDAKIPIRLC